MNKYLKQVKDWENFKGRSASKLGKDASNSLLESSENFRKEVEKRELLDRADDIRQRYGEERGWRMGLRKADDDPLIEYVEASGNKFSGLNFKIQYDQHKPVEIIKRSKISIRKSR